VAEDGIDSPAALFHLIRKPIIGIRSIISRSREPRRSQAPAADRWTGQFGGAGVAHLGIGGDFDGNDQVTIGVKDVSCYPNLFDALVVQGWSTAEIDAVAGRNVLRVMRDVESVAQSGGG